MILLMGEFKDSFEIVMKIILIPDDLRGITHNILLVTYDLIIKLKHIISYIRKPSFNYQIN